MEQPKREYYNDTLSESQLSDDHGPEASESFTVLTRLLWPPMQTGQAGFPAASASSMEIAFAPIMPPQSGLK